MNSAFDKIAAGLNEAIAYAGSRVLKGEEARKVHAAIAKQKKRLTGAAATTR